MREQLHMTAKQYLLMVGADKLGLRGVIFGNHPEVARAAMAVGKVLTKGMNKTELAYDRHLRAKQQAGVRIRCWYFEPTIWQLPHSKGKRNTFRPDFLVVYEDGSQEWVEIKRGWRVKGSKTEYRPGFQGDGRTKLVTFAGAYPHLRVVLRWFHGYHHTWEEEVFNA